MELSSIFIVITIIAILLVGIGIVIYLIVSNKMEFSLTLKRKEQEKDIAIKQTTYATQEAERKRIGEDLHDDIGPQLALLKMQLSMIKIKHPELNPEVLDSLSKQLNSLIQHVRQVSHDLVPPALYELGLPTAIKNISHQLNRMPDLSSSVQIDDSFPTLDKKKELTIYRIIQESVNNAIKHADPTSIDIHLRKDQNHILVKVVDNGNGIKNQKGAQNGIGMRNMRERAQVNNGEIEIQSGENKGTCVQLRLPI